MTSDMAMIIGAKSVDPVLPQNVPVHWAAANEFPFENRAARGLGRTI